MYTKVLSFAWDGCVEIGGAWRVNEANGRKARMSNDGYASCTTPSTSTQGLSETYFSSCDARFVRTHAFFDVRCMTRLSY